MTCCVCSAGQCCLLFMLHCAIRRPIPFGLHGMRSMVHVVIERYSRQSLSTLTSSILYRDIYRSYSQHFVFYLTLSILLKDEWRGRVLPDALRRAELPLPYRGTTFIMDETSTYLKSHTGSYIETGRVLETCHQQRSVGGECSTRSNQTSCQRPPTPLMTPFGRPNDTVTYLHNLTVLRSSAMA